MVFLRNVPAVTSPSMGVKYLLHKEKKSFIKSKPDYGQCDKEENSNGEGSGSITEIVKLLKESLSCSHYHFHAGNVHVFVPSNNRSGYVCSDFSLKIINDKSYYPTVSHMKCVCTPVIQLQPHGTKFQCSDPALIILPLVVRLDANDEVTCHCSNTNVNEDPVWELLDLNDFEVCSSFIKVKTRHFSYFTAVVHKPYPEASKMIFAGVGGTLDIPEVPGVKVTFPGSAVQYDIQATIKVMYADGPYDVDHSDPTSYALATPVIKLGPSGYKFNTDSIEPVEVQLPLPHGKEIMENCGRPHLMFRQSTTGEGQELKWELFETDYQIIEEEDRRVYVRFSVTHFTFFEGLWVLLDSVIHEAKIGASFFYPNFEFCISFQAFMSDDSGDDSFGLCCLCYKKDTKPESIGNYPAFLGSSGLRMVKSGLMQIKIVSNLFESNKDFGEEALVQREFFTGRPFDKQFACKFVGRRSPEQSIIGKIYIERVHDNSEIEPLFDFVLTKPSSNQARPTQTLSNGHRSRTEIDQQSNWEAQLSQELANILSIKTDQDLGDGVWEDVARALGYTSLEIDMKFKDSDEPFSKLLGDYKKRGGSANDFISAMYTVGRNANISSFEQRLRNVLPDSSRGDVEDDVAAHAGSVSPSHTSSSSGVVLPSSPFNSRKRRHTDAPPGPIPNAKLTEVAIAIQDKWKFVGRVLKVNENQITEIERNYKDQGIQEQAYQMLVAWQEAYPDNNYEVLFQALGKLKFNSVARQLYP